MKHKKLTDQRECQREFHPYGIFKSKKTHSLIIGTFPIGKFTNPIRKTKIKDHEMDFYYGGEGNYLWRLLSMSFNRLLESKEDIVQFLEEQSISMADVISSCRRINGGASDADLYDIEWNIELKTFIEENRFELIYFTSRNAARWFEQHIEENEDKIKKIEKIILLSPSANAVRSFPRREDYKEWEKTYHGEKKTLRFREEFYKRIFKDRTKK